MISVFGRTADDRLNFIDFLSLLAVFSDGTSKGEKMEFLFQIYDCDGDGFISKEDLLSIFKRVTAATVEVKFRASAADHGVLYAAPTT